MNDLLIPYAKDFFGEYVSPNKAFRGQLYYCPQCGEEVTLREGERVRAHFAHKPNSECTGESIEHIVAKEWLRKSALDSRQKYLTGLTCCKCHGKTELIFQSGFVDATIEKEWIGNRRPDVMLHTINKKIAVEICRSHAVDDAKSVDLAGWPWFEVTAKSILNDPFVWECTQTNFIVECPICDHESQSLNLIQSEIGKFPRLCKLTTCFHCKKETSFLIGDVSDLFPASPYVHKYFVKKPKRSGYASTGFSVRNRCVHCGRAQPENYPGRRALLWVQPYAKVGVTRFAINSIQRESMSC